MNGDADVLLNLADEKLAKAARILFGHVGTLAKAQKDLEAELAAGAAAFEAGVAELKSDLADFRQRVGKLERGDG